MKKTKHSEEKSAVKQMASGRPVKEVAPGTGCDRSDAVQLESEVRRHGVSDAKRRRAAGGREPATETVGGGSEPGQRRATTVIRKIKACRLLEVDRPPYRYEPRPDRNAQLRHALIEAARQKPRFGYRVRPSK